MSFAGSNAESSPKLCYIRCGWCLTQPCADGRLRPTKQKRYAEDMEDVNMEEDPHADVQSRPGFWHGAVGLHLKVALMKWGDLHLEVVMESIALQIPDLMECSKKEREREKESIRMQLDEL